MTLQLIPSEFPYIWGNFVFFFTSVEYLEFCVDRHNLQPVDGSDDHLEFDIRSSRLGNAVPHILA